MNASVHENLRGLSLEAGAKADELADLVAFASLRLPDDYVEVIRFTNGASGWLRGRYLIVYSVREVIAVNRAADTAKRVPGRLVFGSNGGGTSYLIDLGKSTLAQIYRCEDLDLGNEPPTPIASSVVAFLERFGPNVA